MALQGDVKSLNLASVLQDLAANAKTGTLSLHSRDRMIHFWIEKGMLRLVGIEDGVGPSILNGLVAIGRLQTEQLPDSIAPGRVETGAIRRLTRKHGLTPEDLRNALLYESTEHACNAMLWTEARYTFIECEPDDATFDVSQLDYEVRLPLDALIMDALRRQDEWTATRQLIGPASEILCPTGTPLPDEADPVTRRIFSFVNGENSVEEVLHRTRLGAFTVYRSLAGLVRSNVLRPLTTPEIVERAFDLTRKEEWDRALRIVQYALEREPNHPTLRDLAATCTAALKKTGDAVTHYRHLAAAHLDEKNPQAALEICRKILTLAPADLYAHERVFDILLSLDDRDATLRAAESYVAIARKAGFPEKVRDIYTRLMSRYGEDEELLESLAEIQRHLGERSEAAALYERLLDRALRRRDDERALQFCRVILRLNPSKDEVKKTAKRLESGEFQRLRSRSRRRRIVAVGIFLLVLLLTAAGYEMLARRSYGRIRDDVQQATMGGRSRDAIDLLDRYLADWPWSLRAAEAAEDRTSLENAFVSETLLRARKEAKEEDLAAAVDSARLALRYARSPELLSRSRSEVADLEASLKRKEEDRTREIRRLSERIREQADAAATGELAAIRDRVAVPGLRFSLLDRHRDVRRAAVTALGAIEGDSALRGLVEALADPEPVVRASAAGHLAARTEQSFGEDPLAWDGWILRRAAGTGSVVQASARSVRLRGQVVIEWKIENIGPGPATLSGLVPLRELTLVSPEGISRNPARRESDSRTARLAPGEYLGGRIPLSDFSTSSEGTGWSIRWRPVLLVDGSERTLEAVPSRLEE